MEKIKCVIYARYSSENQREVSTEEQVKLYREYAEKRGYIVIEEYVDKELSGKTANRKRFQHMISDSASRTFQIVLVYANNRFARNRYDKQYYKRKLLENGITINYIMQDILNSDSPDAILFESLDDGISEWYSKNLAIEVMKKGHLPNADKNLHNGGVPPLGLDVVNQKYVVNKYEAEIVKLIFNNYLHENMGYRQIACKLNEMGYHNKQGRDFKDTGIREILLNEKYTGTYVYNRRSSFDMMGKRSNSKQKDDSEIVRNKNAFEAIIDDETFNAVRAIMEKRKGRNATHQAQEVYLLSGIIKCGLCGSNMHGNRKHTNRDKSFHITYKCNKRDKQGIKVCNNKEVNKQYLERAIMHYIAQMCKGDNFEMIMTALRKYAKEQNGESADEKILEKNLSKVEREIGNIVKAIMSGFEAEELKAAYESLKTDKIELQSKLEAIKMAERSKVSIDEEKALRAFNRIKEDIVSNKPIEDYKKMFSAFVDSVEIFESYVIIALNVFYMIGARTPVTFGVEINKPLLEQNQIVVWNGGGEGSRTPVRNHIHKNFSGCIP